MMLTGTKQLSQFNNPNLTTSLARLTNGGLDASGWPPAPVDVAMSTPNTSRSTALLLSILLLLPLLKTFFLSYPVTSTSFFHGY
jgi:hypothetical protein